MIGSLLWLIRSAAIDAVLDGTERSPGRRKDALAALAVLTRTPATS
jgi:hypothetical protein